MRLCGAKHLARLCSLADKHPMTPGKILERHTVAHVVSPRSRFYSPGTSAHCCRLMASCFLGVPETTQRKVAHISHCRSCSTLRMSVSYEYQTELKSMMMLHDSTSRSPSCVHVGAKHNICARSAPTLTTIIVGAFAAYALRGSGWMCVCPGERGHGWHMMWWPHWQCHLCSHVGVAKHCEEKGCV